MQAWEGKAQRASFATSSRPHFPYDFIEQAIIRYLPAHNFHGYHRHIGHLGKRADTAQVQAASLLTVLWGCVGG